MNIDPSSTSHQPNQHKYRQKTAHALGATEFRRRAIVGALCLVAANTASVYAQVSFEDVTDSAIGTYRTETWGVSVGDYNGDNWPDIFVGNHRERPTFYRNNGDGTFTSNLLQIDSDRMWISNRFHDHHGAAFADFDGDGDDDLYVSTNGSSDANFAVSDGQFVRSRASQLNLADDGAGWSASFLDHNKDGRIDIASMSFDNSTLRTQGSTGRFSSGPRISCSKNNYGQLADLTDDGFLDLICAPEGNFPQHVYDFSNGFPRRVTNQRGLVIGNTLDTVIADFDGDLKNEILAVRGAIFPNQAKTVSATRGEAFLDSATGQGNARYTFNATGAVTFLVYGRNVDTQPITINPGSRRDIFAGGIANNANLDVRSTSSGAWTVTLEATNWASAYIIMTASSITNMSADADSLRLVDFPLLPRLLDKVGSTWENKTVEFGFQYSEMCVSAVAEDFDNDMDLDVYMACRGGVENIANRLYINRGNGDFFRVNTTHGAEGAVGAGLVSGAGTSESVVSLDYDNDGFMDVFVNNGLNDMPIRDGGPHQLFRNLGNGNNWVEIELVGTSSSPPAIGASVFATAGGRTQVREQNGGFHRWSQDQQRIHFGLAANGTVDLEVRWPNSSAQQFNNVQANRIYRVVEGQGISTIELQAARGLPAAVAGDECGTPEYLGVVDIGLFLYRSSCGSSRWSARLSGGQSGASIRGRIVELSGGNLSNPSAVSLESDDILSLANDELEFKMGVARGGLDGFDFNATGETCLILEDPQDFRVMLGFRHVDVNGAGLNLATMQPCVSARTTLSIVDLAVDESVGTAEVRVERSGSTAAEVTVTAFTRSISGSAVAGQDFYGRTESLVIPAGQSSAVFSIQIVDDSIEEGTERLQVRLVNANGATISDNVAEVSINDDDNATVPRLFVDDQSVDEAVGSGNLIVRLTPASTVSVSVTAFTRTDGTAQAGPGNDLYGTSRRLTFAPGQTEQSIPVTILNDGAVEDDETFTLRIVAPSGAAIGDSAATITIIDDD